MRKLFMEVQANGSKDHRWEENLSLQVPYVADSARHIDHTDFDDPAEAAMATMDYWNATLRGEDKPRQVIHVYEELEGGTNETLWRGCYPEAVTPR